MYYAERLKHLFKYLGVRGALAYLTYEKLHLNSLLHDDHQEYTYPLYSHEIIHPVYCRPNSSDRSVFWQIFVRRDFSVLPKNEQLRNIVDCGAYTGITSAYFLSNYPDCHVWAIEPDSHNFTLLSKNLQPYGNRVTAIQAALWTHCQYSYVNVPVTFGNTAPGIFGNDVPL